MMFSS